MPTPHATFIAGEQSLHTRDALAHHLARKHMSRAQYDAGREFQRIFALADKRRPGAHMADDQDAAWQALAKCYRQLGHDGSALINDMLIGGLSAKQVAASRGMKGQQWPLYYARRYFEALNTLAETFGFSNAEKKIRASGPKRKTLARNNKTGIGCSGSKTALGILIARPWKCRRRQSDHTPLGWRRRHRDAAVLIGVQRLLRLPIPVDGRQAYGPRRNRGP